MVLVAVAVQGVVSVVRALRVLVMRVGLEAIVPILAAVAVAVPVRWVSMAHQRLPVMAARVRVRVSLAQRLLAAVVVVVGLSLRIPPVLAVLVAGARGQLGKQTEPLVQRTLVAVVAAPVVVVVRLSLVATAVAAS